jgi:hypothetical protein
MMPSSIVEAYEWTGEMILFAWVIFFQRHPGDRYQPIADS